MKNIIFNDHSSAEIIEFDDLEDLASKTIDFLKAGSVALSGGNTYASLYKYWLNLHPDCSHTSFFPVDERIVPFTDPQSNWGTACELFLIPLGRNGDQKHFAQSAHSYGQVLTQAFGKGVPAFDVIFLGMGDDGHTASLFPNGNYFDNLSDIAFETKSPKPPSDRVTLGPVVLKEAKELVTIIAGSGKASVVEKLIRGDTQLPIVRVLSQRKRSKIFIEKKLLRRKV